MPASTLCSALSILPSSHSSLSSEHAMAFPVQDSKCFQQSFPRPMSRPVTAISLSATNVSVAFSDKILTKTRLGRKGFIWLPGYRKSQGRNLKGELRGTLFSGSFLGSCSAYLSPRAQPLPIDSITHNGLGHPKFTSNKKKKASQTCPQANPIEAIHQQRGPLFRCVKLTTKPTRTLGIIHASYLSMW